MVVGVFILQQLLMLFVVWEMKILELLMGGKKTHKNAYSENGAKNINNWTLVPVVQGIPA